MIVYKKTEQWYIDWQRVMQRKTTNDKEWQRMITSGTTHDSEWERVTTSDNDWQRIATRHNEWQRVTTTDNEWQRVVQRITTSGTTNESNKSDFRFQNETIMQCKTTIYSATSFWKYNAEQNIYRSSHQRCSIKKAALNNFEIFTGNHLKAFIKRDSNTSVFLWILQNF